MVVLVCGRGGCGVWDLTVIVQSCSVPVAGTPMSMSGMLWLEKWSPPLSESHSLTVSFNAEGIAKSSLPSKIFCCVGV